MTKRTHWASLCLLGLLACTPAEEALIEKKYPVQFGIGLSEEVFPFAGTKTIPPFNIPEPVAVEPVTPLPDEEVEKEVDELCTTIEYIVFNPGSNTDTLKHKQYKRGDRDFGIIYDSLPAGKYTIAILAHSSTNLGITTNVMRMDKVTDTFHKQTTVDIAQGDTVNQSITLQRVVGKIELVASEPVPNNLKSFTMDIQNHQNTVNILTGKGGTANSNTPITHTFTPEEAGQTNKTHAFLTFIPATGETTLNMTLTARDREDKITRQRTISNITPLANKTIRYSGRLYSKPNSDDTFTIFVSEGGKWGETQNNILDN